MLGPHKKNQSVYSYSTILVIMKVSVSTTAIKKPKGVYLHHTTSGKISESFTLQLTFNNSHLQYEIHKSCYMSMGMVYVRSTTNAIRNLNIRYEF